MLAYISIIIALIIIQTDIIFDNIFLTRVLSSGHTMHLVFAAREFFIVL